VRTKGCQNWSKGRLQAGDNGTGVGGKRFYFSVSNDCGVGCIAVQKSH
jgi:hypothetical protein